MSDVICQLSVNSGGKRERDIINIGDKLPPHIHDAHIYKRRVSFKLSAARPRPNELRPAYVRVCAYRDIDTYL